MNSSVIPAFLDGSFGTISGTVELASLGIVDGRLAVTPCSEFLSGQAYAGTGRGCGGPDDGVADADSGSTLIWVAAWKRWTPSAM